MQVGGHELKTLWNQSPDTDTMLNHDLYQKLKVFGREQTMYISILIYTIDSCIYMYIIIYICIDYLFAYGKYVVIDTVTDLKLIHCVQTYMQRFQSYVSIYI